MKKTFTSLLSALAITALCGTAAHAQTYQQVWADEFTTGISSSWQFETGGGGWGNNEKQYYQAANATVANGILQITAKKQSVGGMPYTSARMITKGIKEFTYGKMEARIKLPLGQGLWPAFWMLGGNISQVGWPACGEIDIMEHINSESKIYGTPHWDSNGHAEYGGNTTTTPADYHIYSVEWDASSIRWFLDGVQYHVMSIQNNAGGTEEFHRPFFLLLNLAVAGNWPGQTVDESKLPATMYVDYVRVYQKTNTPTASSITLQAESANVNNGMVVENCSEGGQNMGYIDQGDYLVWNNVNFPTSGNYLVEYRVASGASGGTISSDLNAGSIQQGNTGIPGTGGWQNWTTVSKTVNVNAGTYNFGIYAQTGGYNLNWVRITKQGSARAATVTAASSASQFQSLEAFPNPASTRLNLRAAEAFVGGQVSIQDMAGRQVYAGRYQGDAVDVAALKPGLYTVTLSQNDQITHLRFVKQ